MFVNSLKNKLLIFFETVSISSASIFATETGILEIIFHEKGNCGRGLTLQQLQKIVETERFFF